MDELIGRLATEAGIDDAMAEKTIGIVLGFLQSEGPFDGVQANWLRPGVPEMILPI